MHTALRRTFASLVLAASAVGAHAENASTSCPALPTDGTQLFWTEMKTGTLLLCRAIDDEGREAFAVTISSTSPFRPQRVLREEKGSFRGETVWWYRGEIVGLEREQVRETLFAVDRGRVAHVFIRSDDQARLQRYQRLAENLRFDHTDLTQR